MNPASPFLRILAWTLTLIAVVAGSWSFLGRHGSEWKASQSVTIAEQPERFIAGKTRPNRLPTGAIRVERHTNTRRNGPDKTRNLQTIYASPRQDLPTESLTRQSFLPLESAVVDSPANAVYPFSAAPPLDGNAWTAQVDVNHFSQDPRAMSPRHWGQLSETDNSPELPLSFSTPDSHLSRPGNVQKNPGFFQVEGSRLREAEEFYERRPFDPQVADDPIQTQSPLPTNSESLTRPPQSQSWSEESDWNESPHPQPMDYPLHHAEIEHVPNEPQKKGRFRPLGGRWPGRRSKSEEPEIEHPPFPNKFAPELGHRSPEPTLRPNAGSSADDFGLEQDREFPAASEILATAVFFSEAEFLFLQPSFQDNTALSVLSAGTTISQPFNFDLEPAFRVLGGFESEYGPGFAGEYFQFDNQSDRTQFISTGGDVGSASIHPFGSDAAVSLIADDLGERLDILHTLEVHSVGVYAFKALNFKRAFVKGRFGLQIVSIDQTFESQLFAVDGTLAGRLESSSNLNAFGPRFGIDYVRRIGHTPMQLMASASGSLLFGDRDQRTTNTLTGEFNQRGADEFLTVIDIFFGVQGKKFRGEKRNTTFRVGFVNQSWIGGGTAADPNGDFGFQGLSLMLGFNR